jgi:thioredoxin 1
MLEFFKEGASAMKRISFGGQGRSSALSAGICWSVLVLCGCAALRADNQHPATVPAVGHVNEKNFDQHVLRSPTPVLVDFYATWCGPCKRMAPILEQVAVECPQARVVKVDVDENRRLAARYGVKSLPSFLVFVNGRVVARQKGVVAKDALKAMLGLKQTPERR